MVLPDPTGIFAPSAAWLFSIDAVETPPSNWLRCLLAELLGISDTAQQRCLKFHINSVHLFFYFRKNEPITLKS